MDSWNRKWQVLWTCRGHSDWGWEWNWHINDVRNRGGDREYFRKRKHRQRHETVLLRRVRVISHLDHNKKVMIKWCLIIWGQKLNTVIIKGFLITMCYGLNTCVPCPSPICGMAKIFCCIKISLCTERACRLDVSLSLMQTCHEAVSSSAGLSIWEGLGRGDST